jgi:hypothetical protein
MKKFLGYTLICIPFLGLYVFLAVMTDFVIITLISFIVIVFSLAVTKGINLIVESEMEK